MRSMYRDSREHDEERRIPWFLQTEIDHFLTRDRNQTGDGSCPQPVGLDVIGPFTETPAHLTNEGGRS